MFKFVQMRENLTFPQAIERLAERAGIKLKPARAVKSRPKEQPPDVDPNRLAKVNAWAAQHFVKNLHDEKKGKSTRDYIAQRQITPESVKKWQLGLAVDSPDDLVRAAKTRNVPMKLLEQAGLIIAQNQARPEGSQRDKFINRLMFPITDVTGRVIGFGGRTLEKEGAKYINSPTTILFDKSNSLYGLEQARHEIVSTGTAIVVEGYTDCIMAHQLGCANVVATLGTSFTAGQGRILRRYAKKAVLIFDGDTAGIEAANRALDVCLSQRIDIKLAAVPEGKDPCDFLLAAGKERFEQLADEAVDVFQFKWNRLTESFGSDDTLAGRKSAIEEFLQTIAASLWAGKLPPLDRGLVLNRLSKIIGLDVKELNAELSRRVDRVARAASYGAEDQKVRSIDFGRGLFATAQREVLEVLLGSRLAGAPDEAELFEIVKQKITAELFDVPILRQTAAILFEALDAEPKPSLAEMLARAESTELGECLVQLAQAGEEKGNFRARLTGALDAIQRCQAQRQKSRIKEVEDQRQFLRRVHENTGRENPHNVGMV